MVNVLMYTGTIIIASYFIVSITSKYFNEKRYNTDISISVSFTEVNDMIDDYISEIFNSYIIMEGFAINTVLISQNEEIEIIRDVSKLVADRMSKILYNKLSIFYNNSAISDIISEKIGMLVMNYRLNHNQNVAYIINQEREDKK